MATDVPVLNGSEAVFNDIRNNPTLGQQTVDLMVELFNLSPSVVSAVLDYAASTEAGVKFAVGEPGRGTYWNQESQTIKIDPSQDFDAKGLVHEIGHFVSRVDFPPLTGTESLNEIIAGRNLAEARAVMFNLKAYKESNGQIAIDGSDGLKNALTPFAEDYQGEFVGSGARAANKLEAIASNYFLYSQTSDERYPTYLKMYLDEDKQFHPDTGYTSLTYFAADGTRSTDITALAGSDPSSSNVVGAEVIFADGRKVIFDTGGQTGKDSGFFRESQFNSQSQVTFTTERSPGLSANTITQTDNYFDPATSGITYKRDATFSSGILSDQTVTVLTQANEEVSIAIPVSDVISINLQGELVVTGPRELGDNAKLIQRDGSTVDTLTFADLSGTLVSLSDPDGNLLNQERRGASGELMERTLFG